jgi:hypothetical protein
MSGQKKLLAYLPANEISVYQVGEELDIDYPDVVDQSLAEEAGKFVLHLVHSEGESLAKIRAAGDWKKLDAAFAEWRRAHGLR